MKRRNEVKKLTLSAMFLTMAFILPFFTGQIPQIGSMLCPMHIPVLLCGFFCGTPWGMAVGFAAPLLRSVTLGMPPLFPTAVCMVFELAAYGFITGFLYNKLPKNRINVYISLISAMVIGRLIWGIVMFACMGLDSSKFGLEAFLAGAVLNAVPGIILQLTAIPMAVFIMEKTVNRSEYVAI